MTVRPRISIAALTAHRGGQGAAGGRAWIAALEHRHRARLRGVPGLLARAVARKQRCRGQRDEEQQREQGHDLDRRLARGGRA